MFLKRRVFDLLLNETTSVKASTYTLLLIPELAFPITPPLLWTPRLLRLQDTPKPIHILLYRSTRL